MFIDVLGVGGEGETVSFAAPDDGGTAAGDARLRESNASYWPLPSVLYRAGFTMQQSGKRVVLLANTNSTNLTATLTGAVGGTLHIVDAAAGHGSVPYATRQLQSEVVPLSPLAVALVELPGIDTGTSHPQ